MFVVGHNNSDVGQTIKYTHLKGRQITALNKTFFKISNYNALKVNSNIALKTFMLLLSDLLRNLYFTEMCVQ